MATRIQIKVSQLRQVNFDLGAQQSAEGDCGYGGQRQTFANATIYYHSVMGSSAHEVHGGIRTKYLSLGGHDLNREWGERLFGFPLTDETNSADGMCRVSRFEWGAIYWTFGCTWVFGKIYQEYERMGAEAGRMGYPISEPVRLSGGVVSFFEHGLMYCGQKSNNQVIEIRYGFPQLGQPWLIPLGTLASRKVISFSFYHSLMNANIAGHLLEDIFNGRLFLKETAGNNQIPLRFEFSDMQQQPGVTPAMSQFQSAVRVADESAVRQSKLYDVVLKVKDRSHTIAAHALYFKDDWNTFRFIHATDVHVSRRLDTFRKFFRDRSMHDAERHFNNFNDNFRAFIRYANKLHKRHELDFVVITGDLVDYIFEDGGKHYYNNNFVFFSDMVLGKTGQPDLIPNEELRVPIFTALGNHDYRVRAYYPLFTMDIPVVSDKVMEQFSSMNLNKEEAKLLTEHHLKLADGKVSVDRAAEMTTPDRENRGGSLNYYFRHINRDSSYVINLGVHRIVMIDGKWDAEPIEGYRDAIEYLLGCKGEATDNFADSSPDSVGVSTAEVEMIGESLQGNGLVVVCMHAPIVNPKHSEYSWFLREYMRSDGHLPLKKQMGWYLFRRDSDAFMNPLVFSGRLRIDLTRDAYLGWSRDQTFYFHQGNGSELLDYGVMRGNQELFLKKVSGVQNNTKPVDLILSGHVHKNFEVRLLYNEQNGKFRFSHEFFTENPAVYYHSYDMDTGDALVHNLMLSEVNEFFSEKSMLIHIQVTDQAAIGELPVQNQSGVWSLRTRPYPLTLNSQNDHAKRQWWWNSVRPLLIQTAALGPSEYLRAAEHQPDFRGCRLVSVSQGVIENIRYVGHQAIQDYQPDPAGPFNDQVERPIPMG